MRSTSCYGAVVVSGSTAAGGAVDGLFDGMNEKGLAPILLGLVENAFLPANADCSRPGDLSAGGENLRRPSGAGLRSSGMWRAAGRLQGTATT